MLFIDDDVDDDYIYIEQATALASNVRRRFSSRRREWAIWVTAKISLNGLDWIFRILNSSKRGLDRWFRPQKSKSIGQGE